MMTKELIGAFTKSGGSYPAYVNVTRDGEAVVLTVRGDPTIRQAAFICGHAVDKGQLGRCTPGDDNCNNYCNSAPEKGPMQDMPKPCEQVFETKTVTVTFTAAEWASVVSAVMAQEG